MPAYPVLFLYSHNNGWLAVNELFLPLALVMLAAGALLFLLKLLARDWDLAAALTAFWGLWFFSYGHVLSIGQYLPAASAQFLERHAIWAWLAIALLGTFLLFRVRRRLLKLRSPLNLFALALVLFSVLNIVHYEYLRLRAPGRRPDRAASTTTSAQATELKTFPDIYYIILDGYARPDVFEELYGDSNERFVNYLESRGFVIAKHSRANYALTELSLASSLNMRYLEDIAAGLGASASDMAPVQEMVKHSAVAAFLRDKGYTIATMSQNGKSHIEADIALPLDKGLQAAVSVSPFPDFRTVLLDMTPLRALLHISKLQAITVDEPDKEIYAGVRRLRLSFFKNLENFPKSSSPRFIYAHLIAPHPPFLFKRDGTPNPQSRTVNFSDAVIGLGGINETRESYLRNYREQLLFISTKLQYSLEKLLAESGRPKVIILQSDHGPGAYFDWYDGHNSYARERMSILNAYYFSDGPPRELYDSITPVNTFRMVFDHYFNANLPLLKDKCALSISAKPYYLIDVTDKTGRLPKDKLPKLPK